MPKEPESARFLPHTTLQCLFSDLSFNKSSWRDDLNIAYNPSEPLRITASRGPDNKGYEIYAINFRRLEFVDLLGINIWDDYDVPDLQVISCVEKRIIYTCKNFSNKTFTFNSLTN